MTTFNAGAIEANLTLGRSSWTRELKAVKKEIAELEKKTITIGIDADADNAKVAMDNLELMLDDLDSKTYTPAIDADVDEANRALDLLDEKLDALDARRVTFMVDADTDNAQIQLNNLENDLDLLDREPVNVMIDVVTREANRVLDELEARLDLLSSRKITVEADADISEATAQMDMLAIMLDTMEDDPLNIRVDMDSADAEAKMIELALAQQRMSMAGIDIDVDINGYARAITQLNILEAQVDILDGREIDLDIDIDRRALSDLVGAAGGDGGGGQIGLLRILLYAILLLAPILAVAMGSLTAAIVAFAAALVGAIGPLVVLGGGLALLVKDFKDAQEAGEELTGPMQAFADSLDSVKDAIDAVKPQIATEGFGLMANALELLADIIPTLVPIFNAAASMIDGVVDSIRGFTQSAEYQEMIDFFSGFGVDMLETFIDIGGNLIQFFGRLFDAIAPFATEMMGGLEEVTAGWAEWADDLENNEAFQHFVDNALEYGPMILDMLGSLLQAFIALGHALEPFAGPMLEALTWFFDLIANADPSVLTAFVAGFAGLWLGMSVIAPLITTVAGGLGAIATAAGIGVLPLLAIVGAIAALVLIVKHLWDTNETFRSAVIDTWNAIRDAITPIVQDVANAIRENWGPIRDWARGVFHDIESIVVNAMIIIRQIVRGVTAVVRAIWNQFGGDIIRIAKTAFTTIGGVIRGAFQIIKGIFQIFRGILTGDFNQFWAGIKNVARGAATIVVSLIRGMYNQIRNIFGMIGNSIDGLIGFFRKMPGRIAGAVSGAFDGIRNNFRTVVNDIVGWWNGLSFSMDIPAKIPGLPSSFTISTPNVSGFATGAYVTDPTLAWVGEGKDNEIVAPEPILREIVERHSGGKIDYDKIAAAVAAALASVLSRFPGVTPEQIERLIEAASVNVNVDARSDKNAARELASAVGFELRLLGYGGK